MKSLFLIIALAAPLSGFGAEYLRCTDTDSSGRARLDIRVSDVMDPIASVDQAELEIRLPGNRAIQRLRANMTMHPFTFSDGTRGIQLQYWLDNVSHGYLLVNTVNRVAGRGFFMPSTKVETRGVPLECQFQ
jgi:hypothetical protein